MTLVWALCLLFAKIATQQLQISQIFTGFPDGKNMTLLAAFQIACYPYYPSPSAKHSYTMNACKF